MKSFENKRGVRVISMILTGILLLLTTSKASGQFGGWIPSYRPGAVNIVSFANSGLKLWAASGKAILLSLDNGMHWSAPDSGQSPRYANSVAYDGSMLYAAIGPDAISIPGYGYGIARSSDDGQNWSRVTAGLGDQAMYSVAISDSNVIAGGSGIFISKDSGETWQVETSGVTGLVRLCTYLLSAGHNLLAVTDQGLLLSSDNGMNWIQRPTLPIWANVTAEAEAFQPIAISGPNLYACNGSDTVFLSYDSGSDWMAIAPPAPFKVSCIAANETVLVAAFGSSGPLANTTNGGLSWVQFGGATRLRSLIVSGPNLVYGSNSVGIEYWPLSELVGQSSVAPSEEAALVSLEPNPTPGPITIRGATGSIVVTNVLGTQVAGSGNRVPGSGPAQLDLSKLPAGTYFVRVTTDTGDRKTLKVIKQ